MTDAPSFAMQFTDLSAGLAFLRETLGFTLVEERLVEDLAYVRDIDGDLLLLAGPTVNDLPSYLSSPKFVCHPGESIAFGVPELEDWQSRLNSKGIADLQVTQNRLGDRVLHVKGPDDYTFNFIQHARPSFEDLLSMYARSLDELDEALAGLSEDEMGLTSYEGGWSIRQIVHHLADADILFGEHMKVALSAPGTTMGIHVPVGNEHIAAQPEYRDRPAATSVALFRAFHQHILDIVKYIPDAGERYVEGSSGRKYTFNQLVHLIVGHTGEHLDEIWEIRRKHGK